MIPGLPSVRGLPRALGAALLALALSTPAAPAARLEETRYEDLLAAVRAQREAFNEALPAKGPAAAGLLDQRALDSLLAKAERQARGGQFKAALPLLEEANALVETAVIKLRSNETVVYSRRFQTPQDEFRFESDRFREYADLVAQALRGRPLDAASRQRIDALQRDGQRLHGAAAAEYSRGNIQGAAESMAQANGRLLDIVLQLAAE